MYDNDIVEEANMSGQLYGYCDIGKPKTSSLFNCIANYSSFFNLSTLTKRYDNSCRTEKVMICGFDNMASRKLFFNKWLTEVAKGSPENCLFIDGRLAAEEFQIFAIQGNDKRAIEEYQAKWLFSDDEAENTLCSYKQTSFMANMIASMMINIFVNFVANKCNPLIPREVPFFTYYSDDNMFLKVES